VVWKTNGFLTRSALDRIAPHLAAVNLVIKSHSEAHHKKLTGAPLQPVLDALDCFLEAGVWVEISTPLIPDFNDDDESIAALAKLIRSRSPLVPWHLLRFIPEFRLAHLPPTSPQRLRSARELA